MNVLVTGASRGIGRAISLAFADAGHNVAVNYERNREAAEGVVRDIRAKGVEGLAARADVSDSAQADRLVQDALDHWGRLDVLVNNAGVTRDQLVMRMKRADWDAVLATNLTGSYLCIQQVIGSMLKQRWGRIINITSIFGQIGQAGQANYSAAKAGIVGLTRTLAKEWGQFKINVNAVAFGFIETRLTAAKEEAGTFTKDGNEIQLGIPEQLRQMASMIIPMGRPGTPEEAAGGVVALCSPWTNYVHGQVLHITGGQFGGMTGG